eukprot:GFYU01009905.1.p1 GENE.GFYU01009905.1~~GFYU01009905.1.p1  ORF type:complete len:508 (-),score=140.68 GFYU01009905.1:64-1437(-)
MNVTGAVDPTQRTTELIITPHEAEAYVQQLQDFSLDEIGSSRWMQQHDMITKLNMQAHHNAMFRHDEYVMEYMVSYDKIKVLIHELIAIELWKEKVAPHIEEELANLSSMKPYTVFYHESACCNLLEILFFHKDAMDAAGDAIIDLADYCVRKVIILNTRSEGQFAPNVGKTSQEWLDKTTKTDMHEKFNEIQFTVCMCALTITRYMTESLNNLPLAVMTRFLMSNDMPICLVPLLETPPWQLKKGEKTWKFTDSQWQLVKPEEMQRVTKYEAQVWLSLYNLIMDTECKKKYELTQYRLDQVGRVRKLMNETLLDQIPMLNDFMRFLEESSIAKVGGAPSQNMFMIEQVPEIRDNLEMTNKDKYEAIAKKVVNTYFKITEESRREEMKRLTELYSIDQWEEVLEDPKCAECGELATKRCSRCKNEWYCGRKCQVGAWKKHKTMCDVIANDSKHGNKQ